jgi:hypothetical protein
MEQKLANESKTMSSLADIDTEIQGENTVSSYLSSYSSQDLLILIYRCVVTLVLFLGFIVGYKLFDNVRKEKHGEPGKVLQWIMKTYALIQAIGFPCNLMALGLLLAIKENNVGSLHPCIIIYSGHILLFFYMLLHFYIGLNSLILAFGRYAFVVQNAKVLKFGLNRMGNILIYSSFIMPFFVSLLASAVISISFEQYNGESHMNFIAGLEMYKRSCALTGMEIFKPNITNKFYSSPIYDLAHSSLPSSAMNSMYVVFVIAYIILYSNVTEGIIYLKSAIFVFR